MNYYLLLRKRKLADFSTERRDYHLIRPERLRQGDRIGIIAPAGPVHQEELDRGAYFFNRMGLRVTFGKSIHQQCGYLAGTDEERLADLHAMFENPEVKAIFCARGGYGTGRIASQLDLECIRQNPKIFWGYSDITYLHTMIREKTGLVTFHGPMVASDIAKPDFDSLSASMFQQLFAPTTLRYSAEISPLNVLVPGESTGELAGGNLSLLVSMLGTPYEVDTTGKMLFIEDVGEEVYRIDAMLNQLQQAGKLKHLAGIVIGDFALTKTSVHTSSSSLEDVFRDYVGTLNCPVLSGFRIGHCLPHFAVPLGVRATLSTKRKMLLVEPGVNE